MFCGNVDWDVLATFGLVISAIAALIMVVFANFSPDFEHMSRTILAYFLIYLGCMGYFAIIIRANHVAATAAVFIAPTRITRSKSAEHDEKKSPSRLITRKRRKNE